MKNLFKNLGLLIVFSFVFSGFFGCTGSSEPNESTNAAKSESKTKKSEAPKDEGIVLPEEVAAVDIEMLEGEAFKVGDNKGKVILLNLWAVWCGPCIQEIPHLNEMQEKYKDKKFEILGLNTGNDVSEKETVENMKSFVKKFEVGYKMGWSSKELTSEFFELGRMSGIPMSLLINREGKLVAVFTGGGPKVIKTMKDTVDRIVNQ